MFWQRLAALVLALSVSACASIDGHGAMVGLRRSLTPPQDVYFFERGQNDQYDTVKLYVDQRGNLYPRNGLPVVFPSSTDTKSEGRNLRELMIGPRLNGGVRLCDRVLDPRSEAGLLCGVMQGAAPDSKFSSESGCILKDPWKLKLPVNDPKLYGLWRAQQAEMWDSLAQEIVDRSGQASAPKTVVILLHGFNVPNADAEYLYAKQQISAAKRSGENIVFVEIHWDGGQTTSSWGAAQYSGIVVGVQLRQLINGIRLHWDTRFPGQEPAMRFVSHSSGAFVLGAMLGDSRSAVSKFQGTTPINDLENQLTRCQMGTRSLFQATSSAGSQGTASIDERLLIPSFKDVRVALFAAATPSNTFAPDYSLDDGKDYPGVLSPNVKFFITVNRTDEALTKYGFGPNMPFTGATGLGANEKYLCRMRRNLRTAPDALNVSVYGFNFTRKPVDSQSGGWSSFEKTQHSWPLYMDQALRPESPFLKLFMGDISDAATFEKRLMLYPRYISDETCATK